MRWVRDHGGPSLGYQSEVEHRKKDEVRSGLLMTWAGILNVTEAFARGQVPRYADGRVACRGIAADVAALVAADPAWLAGLEPLQRCREVLRLIADRSKQTPRVVLAHVLGLTLRSLDAMLVGDIPVARDLIPAMADLTTVPESFLRSGEVGGPGEFQLTPDLRTAIWQALNEGAGQTDLAEWVRLHAFLPTLRQARSLGLSPAELGRRVSD